MTHSLTKQLELRDIEKEYYKPDLLFIINAKAGSGYQKEYIDELITLAKQRFHDEFTFNKAIAGDHPAIIRLTKAFIRKNNRDKIIIAGGGGGTISAVITAVCELKASIISSLPCIQIGALRMGSGNVIAKKLGIPKDPKKGLESIADGIIQKNVTPICIGRFKFINDKGTLKNVYGATLMGFGEFGYVPGDVTRFRKRHPVMHILLVKFFGMEVANSIEYIGLNLWRSFYRVIFPHSIKRMKISTKRMSYSEKIISGVVMNFPIKQLPIHSEIGMSDECLYLHAIRYKHRLDAIFSDFQPHKLKSVRFNITQGKSAEIVFPGYEITEFFIDEDPYFVKDTISITIAGTLDFIGSSYAGQENRVLTNQGGNDEYTHSNTGN